MPERRGGAPDVVIVGGGVMGSACAWELARAGARVLVLEKSVPGAEASSAAAGILGAQVEAKEPGPLLELALASRARYRAWTRRLSAATGIDVGYRQRGVLEVGLDRAALTRLWRDARWQRGARLPVERLSANRAHALEPALTEELAGGVFFEKDACVDPRPLFRALHIAAHRAGVEFRSGAYVRSVVVDRGRARGVALDDGPIAARHVVVAAGSWTSLVDGLDLSRDAVRPVRGQIVELETPGPLLRHVVYGPRCYLVPRDDGRTLVGSTLEFVGFKKEVTARAVRDLLKAALELVPALGEATLRSAWSNFRPYTPSELPLIGQTSISGLVLATGHFRNGILLAPITAEIVSAVVQGRKPPVEVKPFTAPAGRS